MRSRKPGPNQRSADPDTITGVPDMLTWAIRPVHIASSPIFAPVQSSAAAATRSGRSSQELEAHRTADRVAGVEEPAPGVAALGQHVVDHAQHALGQLGHGEGLVGHGPVVAVAREVPGEHVEGVGEPGRTVRPERRRGRAERRAEDEERELGAVPGAGEAHGGDAGDHGISWGVVGSGSASTAAARARGASTNASVAPR